MLKQIAIKIHWFLASQIGLDPLLFFRALRGIPHFFLDFLQFRKNFSGTFFLVPCLHDRYGEGGFTRNEYFWQDLLVARMINKANPRKHVDVGSRVDGFVAHVASFRDLEVLDVRPITSIIPGIEFHQFDLMSEKSVLDISMGKGYCDSLSCLHVLEHLGLGRYGDNIDVSGHERGLRNLAQLLEPNGKLYLSVPIGRERVEFNANRVFSLKNIIDLSKENSLNLEYLVTYCNETGISEINISKQEINYHYYEKINYQLAIMLFTKHL